MPRSRRSNYTPEEIKKNQDKLFGFNKKRPKAQYEINRAKNTGRDKKNDKVVSKTTKQGKPKTKAQLLATKNIKKYGGTAKAAAANKAAMKLKIKKAYLAKKNKKK